MSTSQVSFLEVRLEVCLNGSRQAVPVCVCCRAPGPTLGCFGVGALPRDQHLSSLPISACLGLYNPPTETTREALHQALRELGAPWGLLGVTGQDPSHVPSQGAGQPGQPQPRAPAPPCLSWGSAEVLMFELLVWGMEREADLRLSLACIERICRVSFVSAEGSREPSTSGALLPSPPHPSPTGRWGSPRLCSEQAHICTTVFEGLRWILIKVSPSLGSRPLMVEKLDPRVADASRAEGDARAQLGGLRQGGGSSAKWLGSLFCSACLASRLCAVLCTFQVRYQNCQGRRSSAFTPMRAGRSASVLRGTLCRWPA